MATKVYIVYYSTYGHVSRLAEEIQEGAASVEGVEAKLWQVPEILPAEVLSKMGAPPKSDVPIITPDELATGDGFIFGFPTRFGMMAAQLKAFLDSTGGLWRTQQLAGKPAGLFISTGSQGGGQETTPAYSNDSGDDEPSARPDPETHQSKRPRRQPEYPTHDPYPIRLDRRIPSQGVPRTGAPAGNICVQTRESPNRITESSCCGEPDPEPGAGPTSALSCAGRYF